jgi:hypothetical protein
MYVCLHTLNLFLKVWFSFQWSFSKDKWKTFEQKGILDDSLVDDIWKKANMQKTVLLGLMEKFDLLCPANTQVSCPLHSVTFTCYGTFEHEYLI